MDNVWGLHDHVTKIVFLLVHRGSCYYFTLIEILLVTDPP